MSERAVLYARTSGDDRGRDNLEGQQETNLDYALSCGYTVIDQIAEDDRGVSIAARNGPPMVG